MKKNLKEEKQRKIIKEDWIDDNNLLEYVLEKEQISIGIRFIDSKTNSLKEHILKQISIKDWEQKEKEWIEISRDKTVIAIFQEIGQEYALESVYDIVDHSPIYYEFMDIIYEKKFPNNPLNKELRKIK